jgi:DnaJ-domain-containing protein 1
MVGPVRFRSVEIIYDIGRAVQRRAADGTYRVKDTVDISKEAFEKFRASREKDLLIGGDEQKKECLRDPVQERNLEALDLGLGAGPREIRKAYLEAVKKYHPDKFLDSPPELVKAAEEKTKRLNSAYGMLKKA